VETKSLGFIGGGRITKIFLQAMSNKPIDKFRIGGEYNYMNNLLRKNDSGI